MLVPVLESFHKERISWFGDSLKELRINVWHCKNEMMLNFDFGMTRLLSDALICSSSHCLTKLEITLSRFSVTHVLLKSTMVRFLEFLDSTYLWYKRMLFFG